ncbi:unnamed protein product [Moneuplotes crassus]|uniref:Uncharacterized protein n=1 Tax=Euplotes crassus TaxID=5936 RepID=A0AAD1UP26_EUPCR|nr:unnamed protein product [Moneuplotes crassus]
MEEVMPKIDSESDNKYFAVSNEVSTRKPKKPKQGVRNIKSPKGSIKKSSKKGQTLTPSKDQLQRDIGRKMLTKIYNNPLSVSKSPSKDLTFDNFRTFMDEMGITIETERAQTEFDEIKIKKIEEDYMKQLQDHYEVTKKFKETKKEKVIGSARVIQKYWRLNKAERRHRAARVIQRCLKRQCIKKKLKKSLDIEAIRSRYSKPENLSKIIKIQCFFRRKLACTRLITMNKICPYKDEKLFFSKLTQRRIMYTLSRQIDTYLVQTSMRSRIELEAIDKYDQGLKDTLNSKEYKEYMCVKDDSGQNIWFNITQPLHQALHPLKTEFLTHKKEVYKLAIMEIMKKRQMADQRRTFIYEKECEIYQQMGQELKNLRLKMMF